MTTQPKGVNMNPDDVSVLIEDAYHYLDDLEACLGARQFAHLPRLEEIYAKSVATLQGLSPADAFPFLSDIEHLSERLHLLRDVMVVHAEAIHTQLGAMGQTSKAAKAYTKSGLVSPDESS